MCEKSKEKPSLRISLNILKRFSDFEKTKDKRKLTYINHQVKILELILATALPILAKTLTFKFRMTHIMKVLHSLPESFEFEIIFCMTTKSISLYLS